MSATEALFRNDAYARAADAAVLGTTADGGVVLDRTIFYATSGGQPGDTGFLVRRDGSRLRVAGTVTGQTKDDIVHLVEGAAVLETGEPVKLELDWERRHRLMRMHTACHLLSVVCPFPVTGAAIADEDARIDFDMTDASATREDVTQKLMELVEAGQPVFVRLITDDELAANPGLVKSKNVRPPAGTGSIRLVCIGENASVDSQPCGGTHVANTAEIGKIHIAKIEKKGRENRRFRIRFGEAPAA